MRYKRNESFRYSFGQPVSGRLILHDGSEKMVDILDLSLVGVKFESVNTILEINQEVSLKFKINDEDIYVTGTIVWHKQGLHIYGMKLNSETNEQNILLTEIKTHANKNSVRK